MIPDMAQFVKKHTLELILNNLVENYDKKIKVLEEN